MHNDWVKVAFFDYFLFWCLFFYKFFPGMDIASMILSWLSTRTTKYMMLTVKVRVLLNIYVCLSSFRPLL